MPKDSYRNYKKSIVPFNLGITVNITDGCNLARSMWQVYLSSTRSPRKWTHQRLRRWLPWDVIVVVSLLLLPSIFLFPPPAMAFSSSLPRACLSLWLIVICDGLQLVRLACCLILSSVSSCAWCVRYACSIPLSLWGAGAHWWGVTTAWFLQVHDTKPFRAWEVGERGRTTGPIYSPFTKVCSHRSSLFYRFQVRPG